MKSNRITYIFWLLFFSDECLIDTFSSLLLLLLLLLLLSDFNFDFDSDSGEGPLSDRFNAENINNVYKLQQTIMLYTL